MNSNSVTVITGASKGLGKDLAKLAINEGHEVILNARNEEALKNLQKLATSRVHLVPGDLTKKETRIAIINKAKEIGKIDYLVNNAGYGPIGLFEEETEELTEFTIELNVIALIDLSRRAIPLLKNSTSGRIMNVASVGGITDFPLIATYAATKFAVVGFSKSLNTELAMTNMSCTAFCPAGIRTEFFDNSLNSQGVGLMEKMSESSEKVALGIWKKRDTKKPVVFPTVWAHAQCLMTKVSDPVMRPFTKLYMKKRG